MWITDRERQREKKGPVPTLSSSRDRHKPLLAVLRHLSILCNKRDHKIWGEKDTRKRKKNTSLTCFTLGLPGENFLLEMAGLPMPILGMSGINVVVGGCDSQSIVTNAGDIFIDFF